MGEGDLGGGLEKSFLWGFHSSVRYFVFDFEDVFLFQWKRCNPEPDSQGMGFGLRSGVLSARRHLLAERANAMQSWALTKPQTAE